MHFFAIIVLADTADGVQVDEGLHCHVWDDDPSRWSSPSLIRWPPSGKEGPVDGAALYKTEVRELGGFIGVIPEILDAQPTDGLWEDDRTDEDQIGATYAQLEEAMETGTGPAVDILYRFNKQNRHKMEPIPTFKLGES